MDISFWYATVEKSVNIPLWDAGVSGIVAKNENNSKK